MAAEHSSGNESRRCRGSGLLRDIRCFILAKPASRTLVRPATRAEREDLAQRFQQRLGIDVTTYSILNVHQIGVDAPGRDVYARILAWGRDCGFWPLSLAWPVRAEGDLRSIDIYLFGLRRFLGFGLKPLFRLRALRIQDEPGPDEQDSARYLLYACDGGYPIGHFVMYVRSSIAARGETGPTQVFLAVGFNVYGHRDLGHAGPGRVVTAVWERLHNRVTDHVLNRLKSLCELEFGDGRPPPPCSTEDARPEAFT